MNQINNLIFHKQYIKDLSFENPNSPEFQMSNSTRPNVNINVNVNTKKIDNEYHELVLNLFGDAEIEKKKFFLIELSYGGLFTFSQHDEKNDKTLFIEGSTLLFPFARSIISNITRDGGFSPLYINPINFNDVYKKNNQ